MATSTKASIREKNLATYTERLARVQADFDRHPGIATDQFPDVPPIAALDGSLQTFSERVIVAAERLQVTKNMNQALRECSEPVPVGWVRELTVRALAAQRAIRFVSPSDFARAHQRESALAYAFDTNSRLCSAMSTELHRPLAKDVPSLEQLPTAIRNMAATMKTRQAKSSTQIGDHLRAVAAGEYLRTSPADRQKAAAMRREFASHDLLLKQIEIWMPNIDKSQHVVVSNAVLAKLVEITVVELELPIAVVAWFNAQGITPYDVAPDLADSAYVDLVQQLAPTVGSPALAVAS